MRWLSVEVVCLFGWVLLLTGGCPRCPEPLYEITASQPGVRLPLDESAHCFGGVEWWYYTGRLTATDGRSFGVEAVVFHVPPLPYALLLDHWIGHWAGLDEQTSEFIYDQSRQVGPQPVATSSGGGFQVTTPLLTLEGSDGRDQIHARTSDGVYQLDVTLSDTRAPVLHGGDGYVPYGAAGASFYYSRPRMNVTGTLVVNGEQLAVTGRFWFDRQWGLDLRNPWQRWDWFSIRLDDGTDVMLFQFPGNEEPVTFGTLMPADGDPMPLAAADFSIAPTAAWTSPTTGIEYDVAWEITVPAADLSVSVMAVADNQELVTRSTTFNVYWEGLCDVDGRLGGTAVSGHAFIEQANGGG
jgi:predicted secreted hydrolase